jgi:TolB-like protein
MSNLLTSLTPLSAQACHADKLLSWKEIATYLNCGLRTVQRWEKQEQLPVHRHFHKKSGSVFGYKPELDAWLKSRCAGRKSRPRGRMVLAVLPFHDLGGFADRSNTSEGLTEEIITQIASLRCDGLAVVARSSMQRFENKRKSINCSATQLRAAAEPRVHYLLEGSIARRNKITRITAHLVNADDGTISWAKKYERAGLDGLLLQGEIATCVARSVTSELCPKTKSLPLQRAASWIRVGSSETGHLCDRD